MLGGTELIRRKLGKDAYAMTITLLTDCLLYTSRRVTDHRRAAADQGNGAVAGLLQALHQGQMCIRDRYIT